MSDPTSDRTRRQFLRFRRQAEREAQEPGRVRALARRATDKLRDLGGDDSPLAALRRDLPTLIRMAAAWARGDYRHLPWRVIVGVVAALLYFVAPIDAIPDFIPVIGYLDDAAVVAYVLKQFSKELDAFDAWEAKRPRYAEDS